ncbi:(2Fe-2S)-binding protein [Marinobacterium nitratireducens]|uniref:(2Fe-2S)-binding protein n=1 Tax=Marinobacterium nitratireducens TaxID=518897 RepID=A0A917Z983_9GAMM|nr:aromatic ring-hydroxylating dioxygenase subunit alpha [Marinobacterium nitratireducens]GGO76431.1 (2Fe-2S)-binding protein [Marinobacterium nitratireducens]
MTVSLMDPTDISKTQDVETTPFPLDRWYVAALGKELTDKPLGRTLLNRAVVMYRTPDGQIHALEDRCCHRDLPLSLGTVEERGVRCGYHGLLFDGSGKCLEVPGQAKVPSKAKVSAYPVREQDSIIWIWMGSDASSEPNCEPPEYKVHSDERYRYDGDVYHYNAPYQLIHDNLLDLSHLGYVHLRTIGGNASIHMNAEMKVESEGDSVRVLRLMPGSTPPPTYTAAYPFKDKVDRWQEIVFHPSHLEIWTGAVDANTESLDDPNRGGFHLRGFHGVTPETDETCFYFWTQASNPVSNPEETMKLVIEQTAMTFDEDKVVIEAQYANMKRFPDKPMIDIHVDVGPNRARRIVDRLRGA